MKFHKPFGLIYAKNKLYWVDYLFHSIYAYDLSTKQVSKGELSGGTFQPWYIVPFAADPTRFYVNNGVTNYEVQWDGTSPNVNIVRPTFTVENGPMYVNHTLAFAQVAPNCDLVFGTLGTKLCVDQCNSGTYVHNKKSGVKKIIANQIEAGEVKWNADGTKMYQIDPCGDAVREYDYDAKTGKICNKIYKILIDRYFPSKCGSY